MAYTYEQIIEQYKRLPQDVKEAIDMLDPAGAMGAIGQKHNLHIDEIGKLADQTAMVIIGFVRPENFTKNLERELNLSAADANAIGREVNEQIFLPIRESLMKLHEVKEAVEAREASGAVGGVETIQTPAPTPPQSAGELPDKDKLLDEIEHPAKTPQDTVFEKKLGQLFRIPREEVDLGPYLERPE